ncbi:MAG: response regulator transcription factor [Actinomycetota bacterium]
MTGVDLIKVLVVDDGVETAEAFAEALREHGIDVVATASNGSEAVTLVHALRPQVVLMDVRMPVMDGIKATRVITAAGTSTKILMMTAFDDDSLVNEAMEAGADGYLVKGTLVADTVQAIRSAVSKPKPA